MPKGAISRKACGLNFCAEKGKPLKTKGFQGFGGD